MEEQEGGVKEMVKEEVKEKVKGLREKRREEKEKEKQAEQEEQEEKEEQEKKEKEEQRKEKVKELREKRREEKQEEQEKEEQERKEREEQERKEKEEQKRKEREEQERKEKEEQERKEKEEQERKEKEEQERKEKEEQERKEREEQERKEREEQERKEKEEQERKEREEQERKEKEEQERKEKEEQERKEKEEQERKEREEQKRKEKEEQERKEREEQEREEKEEQERKEKEEQERKEKEEQERKEREEQERKEKEEQERKEKEKQEKKEREEQERKEKEEQERKEKEEQERKEKEQERKEKEEQERKEKEEQERKEMEEQERKEKEEQERKEREEQERKEREEQEKKEKEEQERKEREEQERKEKEEQERKEKEEQERKEKEEQERKEREDQERKEKEEQERKEKEEQERREKEEQEKKEKEEQERKKKEEQEKKEREEQERKEQERKDKDKEKEKEKEKESKEGLKGAPKTHTQREQEKAEKEKKEKMKQRMKQKIKQKMKEREEETGLLATAYLDNGETPTACLFSVQGDLFFCLGNYGNLYVFSIERGEKEGRAEGEGRPIPSSSSSSSSSSSASSSFFSSFSSSFSSSLSSSFSASSPFANSSIDGNSYSTTSSSSLFNPYVPSKSYTKNFRMELLCKTSLHPLMGVSLAYNEKEGHLAVGSSHGLIRLFRLAFEHRTVAEFLRVDAECMSPIVEMFFNVNHDIAFGVSSCNTLVVVDCKNRVKRLVSLKKDNRAICVEFDYATSRLFIGNADETISIYDLAGDLLATLDGHEGGVRELTHDSYHSLLYSASFDMTVAVWKIAPPGREKESVRQCVLHCHDEPVNAIVMCPSIQSFVSGSSDRSLMCVHHEDVENLKGHVRNTLKTETETAVKKGPIQKQVLKAEEEGKTLPVLVVPDSHESGLRKLTWCDMNRVLASSANENEVKFWSFGGLRTSEDSLSHYERSLLTKEEQEAVFPPPSVKTLLWVDLMAACAAGDPVGVQKLLAQNIIDINHAEKGGDTALHKAVLAENLTCVRLLMIKGARLTSRNYSNQLPFHLVRKVSIAKTLLLQEYLYEDEAYAESSENRGSEDRAHTKEVKRVMDAVDNQGRSLLHLLAGEEKETKDHLDLLDYLLCYSSRRDTADKKGFTPLMIAASRNNKEMVKRLMSAGANPHVLTSSRDTILHLACRPSYHSFEEKQNQEEVVRLLLAAGLNPEAQNHRHETPIDIAWTKSNSNLRRVLTSKQPMLKRNL